MFILMDIKQVVELLLSLNGDRKINLHNNNMVYWEEYNQSNKTIIALEIKDNTKS